MSMCSVFSCVVGGRFLLWSVHSLGKTLLAFALIHSVFQSQISRYCRYWLCTLAFHSLMMKRTSLFFVLVLEGLVSLHRTVQRQLLQRYWLGHRLGLPWYWMVCLGNEQRSFCRFWDCIHILHFGPFVDCDGYSISSKGFLPTVVDIMVIWVKFTHSSPF